LSFEHGVGDSLHKPSSAMDHSTWPSSCTTLPRSRKTPGTFLKPKPKFCFVVFFHFLYISTSQIIQVQFTKLFTSLIWKIGFGADQDIASSIDTTAGD